MERVVPWGRLCGVIEPHYPQGKRGRPPVGIERMLRIYFLQQWYALADEALEDALYDCQAMRTFAGIDLGSEAVPDATTLLKFRHLLEAHDLTRQIFAEVGALLSERKLLMKEGTIVDATIIAAPSSTKNARKERDPEMHQTKKGNQWYFGMKAHIGVDAQSGLVNGGRKVRRARHGANAGRLRFRAACVRFGKGGRFGGAARRRCAPKARWSGRCRCFYRRMFSARICLSIVRIAWPCSARRQTTHQL